MRGMSAGECAEAVVLSQREEVSLSSDVERACGRECVHEEGMQDGKSREERRYCFRIHRRCRRFWEAVNIVVG